MPQQKKYWLISDVVGHFSPYPVYGKGGTEVCILHDHNDMVIVQDSDGNIFHCRTDNLTTVENQINPAQPKAEDLPQKEVKATRGHKKKVHSIIQSNLF